MLALLAVSSYGLKANWEFCYLQLRQRNYKVDKDSEQSMSPNNDLSYYCCCCVSILILVLSTNQILKTIRSETEQVKHRVIYLHRL